MKCKMYFKTPVQVFDFEFDNALEILTNEYINNESYDVVSVKRYGRVNKLVVRNYWGGLETIKIKSFSR